MQEFALLHINYSRNTMGRTICCGFFFGKERKVKCFVGTESLAIRYYSKRIYKGQNRTTTKTTKTT